jgi:Terminase RNaseH-like domain
MRDLMYAEKLKIAGHNTELLEELRHYHRDENYKIVKVRDDLVSALRYAVMMKRYGKPIKECEGIGHGPLPYAAQRRRREGPITCEGLDFDLWTGR